MIELIASVLQIVIGAQAIYLEQLKGATAEQKVTLNAQHIAATQPWIDLLTALIKLLPKAGA